MKFISSPDASNSVDYPMNLPRESEPIVAFARQKHTELATKKGEALRAAGHHTEAAEEFRKILASDVTNGEVWLRLVMVLRARPDAESKRNGGQTADFSALSQALGEASDMANLAAQPLPPAQRAALSAAQFLAAEAVGDMTSAWRFIIDANRIEFERAQREFQYFQQKQAHSGQLHQFLDVFKGSAFPPSIGSAHQIPIFVIGLHGSGAEVKGQVREPPQVVLIALPLLQVLCAALGSHYNIHSLPSLPDGPQSVFKSLADQTVSKFRLPWRIAPSRVSLGRCKQWCRR